MRECDKLALIYSQSANVFNEVEIFFLKIQAKKATKFQQKKEKKVQIKFNTLKRQRNEVLAQLYVISSHIGKGDEYLLMTLPVTHLPKKRTRLKKLSKQKWQLRFLCMKRSRGMHKSKPKRKSKGKERRQFILIYEN